MTRITGLVATAVLSWMPGYSYATNYFVDAAIGNDNYTGTSPTVQNGGSNIGPWRSLPKVSAAPLQPSDAVYFRCGQSWRGSLRVVSSPSAASPIRYSRYGSDCNDTNKPTITAGDTIRNWQQYSGNIYVATVTSSVYQVHVDGVAMRLAQHPNIDTPVEPWSTGMLVVDSSLPSPNAALGLIDADLAAIADRDLVGAGLHVRLNDYTIADRIVGSFNPAANSLTVTESTSFSIRPKWGYYLDNKLWMLDAPGEFFFDGSNPAQMKVYLWMPDGSDPGLRAIGSSNAYAIDATSATNVVIEAMRTDKAGAGIAMSLSTNVVVRSVDVQDSYYRGIVANSARDGTIDNCTVRRSVREGILTGTSTNFKITSNRVIDSGNIGSPVNTRGAIQAAGENVAIKGNFVQNSGYHGIAFGPRNDVANNRVDNVCLALSDCGGIYTGNSRDGIVFGNIVTGVHGNRNGRDPAFIQIITPGIYLDYRTANTYVAFNTISDADMGIFLHAASANTVTDNTFHDFATFAIRIKEYPFIRISPANQITRNRFLGLTAGPPIMLVPAETSVTGLAAYEGNRYSAMYTDNPETLEIAKITTFINGRYTDEFLNIQQWRQAGNDTAGTLFDAVRIGPFAYRPVTGVNLVPGGTFDANLGGWFGYAELGDAVANWSSACLTPGCVQLTTGALSSSGSLISTVFPVEPGKTYVASFSDRALVPSLPLMVVPRMAGPRTYEPFQDRYSVTVLDGWRNHSVLFNVAAGLVIEPGDFGGRVDFAAPPNSTLFLDNVRVEEVSYTANVPEDDSRVLLNATSFVGTFSCPDTLTEPQKCAEYVYFDDATPVTWPVTVPARRSTIIVWAGNPFRRP